MLGDIVFINNGKLINYKSGTEKIKADIRNIAEALSLPKKITNPSRMRFYLSENTSAAERFLVFHKNILIKTIEADGCNLNIDLSGTKGNVILNIENNKARVIKVFLRP